LKYGINTPFTQVINPKQKNKKQMMMSEYV
jgi:hypothetical protein